MPVLCHTSRFLHTKIALLEMNIDVCSSACVCRYCRNWPEPAPVPLPQQQPWELSQGNDTHQDHAADDADVTGMAIFRWVLLVCAYCVAQLAAYFIHGSWPSRIEHLLALNFTRSRKHDICPWRTIKILDQISPMARRSRLLAH